MTYLAQQFYVLQEFDKVLPCVDFSHLYARTVGQNNTYDDFSKMFEYIGNELGEFALNNFHAHIAGIEFTKKGERKHLNLFLLKNGIYFY